MATLIKIYDMREYRTVLDRVVAGGRSSSPRGLPTRDLGPTLIQVEDPTTCLAIGVNRGLSPRVAAVEALQLICGFHSPDLMLWASPAFRTYQDSTNSNFWGAYGQRIGSQLHDVIRKLKADRETRQAVVALWDPDRDNDPGHLDYPCTVGFGLRVVGGRLDMWTTMRSNDVWLGFPYDVFQFTQLQLTVARLLDVEVGTYAHFTGSLHIYDVQVPGVDRIRYASQSFPAYQPEGLGGPLTDSLDKIFNLGRRMVQMPYLVDAVREELSDSERWYLAQVEGFATREPKAVVG